MDMTLPAREFAFSRSNFAQIRELAYRLTGIRLTEHKRNMAYGRLSRRLRKLGCNSFDQYCTLIATEGHPEQRHFINAITTNLTAFFREPHHFEFLKESICPELVKKSRDQRLRFWSAGCSTGEEPYSIAMIMKEALPMAGWDVKLLATDLDSNVLSQGQAGVYTADRVEMLSESRRKRWFLQDRAAGRVKVKPALQEVVSFKCLNLLEPWPMGGPFDVIFCRNVVIYFDRDTQRQLFNQFADILSPGGYLFIGHSENLHQVSNRFQSLGKTIYRLK